MFIVGLIAQLMATQAVVEQLGDRIGPLPPTDQPPVYPYAVYHWMENPSEYTADIRIVRHSRVQFDFLGSMEQCANAYQAVKRCLDAYNGSFPDGTRIINLQVGGGLTSPSPIDPSIVKMSKDFVFTYQDSAD